MRRHPVHATATLLVAATAHAAPPADCDADAIPDGLEISPTPDLDSTPLDEVDPNSILASLTTWTTLPDATRVPFDADADDDVDIVVLHHVQPAGFTLYFNDGKGAFPRADTYTFNAAGQVLAAADIDGDEDPDLLLNTDGFMEDDDLLVYKNDGDGTFTKAQGVQGAFSAIALADFDGDGAVDLASDAGDEVVLYFNDGSGVFTFADALPGALGSSFDDIAAGDLNDDGAPEIVAAHEGGVRIYLNAGNGTFPFSGDVDVFEFGEPNSIHIADMTGDGLPDILVGDGAVAILENTGGAVFAPAVIYASFAAGQWLEPVDMDADGDIDIAFSGHLDGPKVGFARNLGDGTIAGRVLYDAGFIDVFPNIAAADLDGDAIFDLVTVEESTKVVRYDNAPLPPESPDCNANARPDACDIVDAVEFGDPTMFSTADCPVWAQATGVGATNVRIPLDLDDDGFPDLVAANENDMSLSVLLNLGTDADGWLGFGPPMDVDTVGAPVSLCAADFDNDGDVCNEPAGDVRVHYADGAGDFPNDVNYDAGGTWIAAAEITGDNYVDIVSSVAVMRNKADGTGDFFDPDPIDSGGDDPLGVAAGDFDADGDTDLAIGNGDDGTVGILFNEGAGQFDDPAVTYEVGTPHSLDAADLDGDGDIDIVVTNNEPGVLLGSTIMILPNEGDGTFAPPIPYSIFTFPISLESSVIRFVCTADLNADGDPDIVAPSRGDEVAMLLSQGQGAFMPLVKETLDTITGRLDVVDVDLDGRADLLVPVQFADQVWRFPVEPAGAESTDGDADGIPDECQSCPADCNDDARLSILDFVCFQIEWQGQTPFGDCDDNGVYNVLDFVCFQTLFQQGCP